jgi:hypothetical protein
MSMTWPTPALLLIGIALGPSGLNVLSPSVLLFLDPMVAMALALLGAFVGFSVDVRQSHAADSLAAPVLTVAVGVAIGVFRETSPGPLLLVTFALAGIAVVIAFAAWLLVGQTTSEREQHAFVVGSLLLIGGAASYLSLSALLAGFLAGAVWNAAGNLARVRIVRDLEYFEHPLVVLLLLVAGASVTVFAEALALAVVFLALQVARRSLLPVGVVVVALALDAFRAWR